MAITHRLDDAYIEKAWKRAAISEIENLAAKILLNAQEAQSIEADLFHPVWLQNRCWVTTG